MKTLEQFNAELAEINKGTNKSSIVRAKRQNLINEARAQGFAYKGSAGFVQVSDKTTVMSRKPKHSKYGQVAMW